MKTKNKMRYTNTQKKLFWMGVGASGNNEVVNKITSTASGLRGIKAGRESGVEYVKNGKLRIRRNKK